MKERINDKIKEIENDVRKFIKEMRGYIKDEKELK